MSSTWRIGDIQENKELQDSEKTMNGMSFVEGIIQGHRSIEKYEQLLGELETQSLIFSARCSAHADNDATVTTNAETLEWASAQLSNSGCEDFTSTTSHDWTGDGVLLIDRVHTDLKQHLRLFGIQSQVNARCKQRTDLETNQDKSSNARPVVFTSAKQQIEPTRNSTWSEKLFYGLGVMLRSTYGTVAGAGILAIDIQKRVCQILKDKEAEERQRREDHQTRIRKRLKISSDRWKRDMQLILSTKVSPIYESHAAFERFRIFLSDSETRVRHSLQSLNQNLTSVVRETELEFTRVKRKREGIKIDPASNIDPEILHGLSTAYSNWLVQMKNFIGDTIRVLQSQIDMNVDFAQQVAALSGMAFTSLLETNSKTILTLTSLQQRLRVSQSQESNTALELASESFRRARGNMDSQGDVRPIAPSSLSGRYEERHHKLLSRWTKHVWHAELENDESSGGSGLRVDLQSPNDYTSVPDPKLPKHTTQGRKNTNEIQVIYDSLLKSLDTDDAHPPTLLSSSRYLEGGNEPIEYDETTTYEKKAKRRSSFCSVNCPKQSICHL
jgi:hypothetical protein